MKKIKLRVSYISWILIFCCLINLYGCFSYSLRAESIVIDETTVPEEIAIDDFELSQIKLLVTRVDGSVDSISVTEEMLSSDSLKELKKSGVHNLYVRYDGKLTVLTIKLVNKYSNVTVTFDTNGGSKVSSQIIEKYSKAFRPINPTKQGYIFSGWYLDKSLTQEFLFSIKIEENITLYAKWEEAINTISYNTNGANSIADSKVKTGEKLYEIIPVRDGYAFDGWYKDSELTIKYDYNTIVNESFVLYAKWEANKHRITFKCNGGTGISSINVNHDEKLINDFVTTKKGYQLEGWYLDKELTEKYNFDSLVQDSFTLYAKWERALLKVSFEVNGGTEIDAIFIEYGKKIQDSIITNRENAIFIGWYLDSNFENIFDINDEIVEDVVLYAKWQMNDIVVSFETNGGSKIENQMISYGSKITLPQAPTRLGYVFVGWCTNSNLNIEFDFGIEIYENTTIYAKWILDTSIKNKYTVVIFNEAMEIIDSFKVEEGSKISDIVPPTVDLKMFAGWYIEQSLSNKYDLDTIIKSNISLYAKYVDIYNVEYLDKDGNTILIQQVGEGMDATPPMAPEVKGYTFVGWDKELTNITSSVITKAIYTTYKYEVKFFVNGKVVSTQKVANGSYPQEPKDFDKYIETGYHFSSWDIEIGPIYQNTTYVAVLEKNVYLVKFVDAINNVYLTSEVKHGEYLEKPSNEINNFYNVLSWYDDNTYKKYFDFNTPILSNICVYGEFDFNERIIYSENNNELTITRIDLKDLKEINIPNNLNSKKIVGVFNFVNYDETIIINIPSNIELIDVNEIIKFKNLQEINVSLQNDSYCSIDGVLYDEKVEKLFIYPKYKTNDTFLVPDTVNSIENFAFSENEYLTKIDLNNVSNLKKQVFAFSNIICLNINKDGILIDEETFDNCNSSIKIIVTKDYYLDYKNKWLDMSNNIYSTEYTFNNFLYNINNNEIEIVEYLGSSSYVEVPNIINGIEVKSIKKYAFNSNFDLKGITLPSTITKIEDYALNNLKLEYFKINSKINFSNEYLLYLKDNFISTNIYVLDSLYEYYKNDFSRCYLLSQIYSDYAYIYTNGSWGILQYFGNESEITLPSKYKNNNITFLDKNIIISEDVEIIKIKNKISINSDSIDKSICFLVDEEYLDYYSEYDYAFYPNDIILYNGLKYVYGLLDNKIIIVKITSKLSNFVIPDFIDGKKVEYIGRYCLIENESIETIQISENIKKIGKNALVKREETGLKIIFKPEIAPSIEEKICYDSDELYKTSYNQKEYGIRFSNHIVKVLGSVVKQNDEYEYYLFNNEISIIKYLSNAKELVIPSEIDGAKVVSIEANAFNGKVTITKIVVPSTVETIGYLAFDNMRNLSEITIESNKVIYIEDVIVKKAVVIRVNDSLLYRYRNSENWLKQEVYSKNSELINDGDYKYIIEGNEAIIVSITKYNYNLMLNNYINNYKIKKLAAYSFYETDINKLYIYKQIDEIGYCALPTTLTILSFSYSVPPKLDYQEAKFEVKVDTENYESFKNDLVWSYYSIYNLLSEKKENSDYEYLSTSNGAIITKYYGNSKELVLPDTIDSEKVIGIGENAFAGLDITSVKFGANITSIEDFAFYNCTKLAKIEFSNSISYIGENAFENTEWLKKNSNEFITIGRVLYKYNSIKASSTNVIIPNGITFIAAYAFENAENISSITFPISVQTIKKGAFKGCSNLINIEIPTNVERIESETFANCTRLKEVVLSKNTIYIGRYAFSNCSLLNEIDFSNVEEIDDYGFSGCEKLLKIVLPSTIKKIGSNIFEKCTLLSEVKIENSSEYSVLDGVLYNNDKTILIEDLLKYRKRTIDIPVIVNKICENSFYESSVEKVIINGKVEIENNAFGKNEYLQGIIFTSSNIPTISERSFEQGIEIYFPNKIIDKIKNDYIYKNYIVHSILEFSENEYTINVSEELELIPICPLDYNEKNISYSVNSEDIITVSSGKVVGKKVGTDYIIVTLKGKENYVAMITINVERKN